MFNFDEIENIVKDILNCDPDLANLFQSPNIKQNVNDSISVRINDALVFKILTNKKQQLFGVKKSLASTIQTLGIDTIELKSDRAFCYFLSSAFAPLDGNSITLNKVLARYISEQFTGDCFGCCGRYEQCSDEKHCIHPDKIHAQGCMYGKNLLAGRIFYGKNRNI